MFRMWLVLLLFAGWVTGCASAEPESTSTQSEEAADEHDDHDDHDDKSDEHHDEEEGNQGDERRESGAHEHGAAEMTIAWTGSELAIELLSPAYNVLGFEYAPSSEDELALADESVAALEAGAFLQFSASANCELTSADVHADFLTEEHDEDEAHEDHEDEEAGTHSDIDVEYSITCEQPDRLSELDLSGLFVQFPNFEDLSVQWLSDTQQSAATISAENTIITLE